MAAKFVHHIEPANLQMMAPDLGSLPLQVLPSSKPYRQKSHWHAAKKALRSAKNINSVTGRVLDYCPSHTPLHSSFNSEESLALLLSEILQRDTELQECLDAKKRVGERNILKDTVGESFDIEEEERDKFDEETDPKPKQIPEDLKHFQDFVNLFLSLFLQSEFSLNVLGISNQFDSKEIIRWLVSTQSCPDVTLFCRVAVDPNIIAGADPEVSNLRYAENGVSFNQLARFLDIAVLRFLSAVNEHTETHAVVWALNYLINLLQSLISSMNTLNSFGWYGAPHIRIRKGTAVGRQSISYPLEPPTFINPPVVVVGGTPPNSPQYSPGINVLTSSSVEETRDPVTGQRSPVLSPLVAHSIASELAGQDLNSSFTAGHVGPSVESSCNHDEITTITTTTAEVGTLPLPSRDAATETASVSNKTRRTSRQESKGIVKRSSFDISPPGSIGNRGSATSTSDPLHEVPHNHSHQQPLHGILKTPFTTESINSPPQSRSPPRSVLANSPPSNTMVTGSSGRRRKITPAGPPPGFVPAVKFEPPVDEIHTMGTGSGGRKRKVTPAGPPPGFVPAMKFEPPVDEINMMGTGSSGRRRKLTPAGPPPCFVPGRIGLSISLPRRSRSRLGTDNMISIEEEKETFTSSMEVDDLERSVEEEVDPPTDQVHIQTPSALETYNPPERHACSPPERYVCHSSPKREVCSPLGREVTSSLCVGMQAIDVKDTLQPQASPSNPNLTPTQDHSQNHTHSASQSPISSPFTSPRASLVHNHFSDASNCINIFPVPKDLPNIDVAHELSTFTNGEGRISLLAILHAITKLPECKALWSEEVGEKCFSLIQHCIDIGLPQKEDTQQSSSTKFKGSISLQDRKKRLTKQDNITDKDRKSEKPWVIHGRHIVEFSVKALIQCSTCSLIGCSTDTNCCRLRQFNVSSSFQKSSMHNKLIRNLKRINLHSPTVFRKALVDFAHPSMSSCQKIFHFLHVVLQYCLHGVQEVHFNPLLDAVVVATLGMVVDRLASLDISEISIQESIIREACDFISYSNHLFHQDVEVKSRMHLHMYIHRIALSVILPPRPNLELTEAISPFHAPPIFPGFVVGGGGVDYTDSAGSFGRLPTNSSKKLIKQRSHISGAVSSHEGRSGSLHLTSFSWPTLGSDAHSPSKVGASRSEKSPLIKQHSLLQSRLSEKSLFSGSSLPRERKSGRSRGSIEDVREEVKVKPVMEWKGLKLNVLRSRVQRLSVLLELSEPGTIPDAGMLASLVDMCDGTTVVARSMVFLECAMFVHKLSSHSFSLSANTWVCHNFDTPRMQHVVSNLHKWAEAIGERLRLAELKEKEMYNRLKRASVNEKDPVVLPEEPVFPDDYSKDVERNRDSSKTDVDGNDNDALHFSSSKIGCTVSYALKMSACNLLLEITRFIRDIPSHFIPSISQASTPLISGAMHSFDRLSDHSRKCSNTSVASSENEFVPHYLNPRLPEVRMSNYGSSLSVEDPAEMNEYLRGSMDEGNFAAALNNSPRKSRTSIYLHINPSINKGNLSKNVSTKRQSRMVLVSEGADSKATPKPFSLSSSRSHRRSISSANMQHVNMQHESSFAGGLAARRPSLYGNTFLSSNQPNHPGGFTNLASSYLLKDRRKSIGPAMTHSLSHSSEMSEFLPPLTPSTPHTQQFKYGGGGGGGNFLGTSLNIGFTKLKRSAQRAFRRHGIKSRFNDSTSPNSSPGTSQRSKSRKTSTSESYTQRSSFISLLEEFRGKYPWLDVMEHLILVDTTNADAYQRHKQSCLELTVALKKVYSGTFHGAFEEEEEEGRGGKERGGRKDSYAKRTSKGMKRYSSLGGIFIHPLIANDSDSCSNQRNSSANVVSYNRWNSLPNSPNTCIGEGTLRSGAVHYPRKISTDLSSLGFENQRKSFPKKVGFVDLTYIKYLNSFMGEAIVAPGSNMTSEENVRLTFEAESPFEKSYVMTQTDKEYCNYIDSRISGLMHVPFSTLIHAAPVLHSRTFGVLKGIAWEVLLSSDCELSQAAGAFFLLASVRESETGMNGFVKTNILNQASAERSNNAILKFKVLWDCRYGVWPRMEGRSQKKFIFGDKEDKEKKEQTIGYSQLANPLGHQGVDLPLSPSDPVSVCTSRVCADNPDKCYRPTKMAPVVHPKEISGKVHAFHVSGVSVPQEVGGTKSNSVVYKVDSDDVAGVREWEAVDPTLFPHSLLPLIKFLLSALIPANINPSPSSHDSSHNSSPSKHSANSPQLEGSELARQVVWTCMVEDPRLFFRSLLNRFNKLYMIISDKKQKRSNFEHLIADTLEPFHIVLQTFPKLPPRAAHMLLNNFVGVIMQHTDQPYSLSGKVIQSVLTLISMVTCSVQGLDSKLLKSYLKKESCYTSMMASARIRGVERVVLVTDHIHYERKTYRVTDDMTFGHLMDDACHIDQSTRTLLNNWYLLDESKDLPVLSTMFIQDHYSAPSDKTQHPTFILRKMTNPAENVWGNQMDQLFVFKMSEVMRVLFNTQLLLTGPEVEKGHAYSEYALPNYQFIHNELVELNSFPRKALTSVQYEAGPSALHFQLHASDIMLKGMWVRFVMQLMVAASRDYDWSNSMLLFMNVVNGSLLLHSEDHTILYYSLATILITVTKFNSVFKKDGYQMVVPALVNIYHLHMKNKIITNAIKFVWVKFYILNGNSFISQVMAAASTLLSEEAAFLSNNISSSLTTVPNRSSSNSIEAEEAKRLIAKALFELNGSLVDDKHRVKDELNILHCCFHHLDRDLYSLLTPDSLHYLSIKETALLAIVLASWNPEAIRGMQVLIFLEHMMSLFLLSLGSRERKFITDAMQYLIKKCESISKPTQIWRGGDILSSRINGAKKTDKRESVVKIQKRGQSFAEDDVTEPLRTPHPRKSSMARVMNKILYNPNRKEVHSVNIAEDDGANSASGKGGEGGRLGVGLELGQVDRATYQNQFRLRGLQNTDHKILQMSRNALLSIISECSGYYSKVGCMVGVGGPGGVFSPRKFSAQMIRKVSTLRACIEAYEPTTKLILDPNSVLVAVNIACQMLKQGTQSEVILQSKGLNRFFSHFLLSLDWTENHFSSFNALLHRLVRLFKQMQRDSSKAIMVWDHLTNFILGLTLCIHHNPQLVLGQDQILARLKALLETVMLMQGNRGEQQAISALHKKLRSMHPSLLESAPSLFSDAVIELAVELIVITNSSQNSQRMQSKFRYHITDLILQKSLKDHEDFLMPKIILPLCIQLGLRADCYSISGDDVDFFMMFIDSKVDVSHKFKLSADIPELILRVLKVFCCAFSEALTLHQWNRVAQWIIALFNRKLSLPPSSMRTSTTSISNEVVGVKKMARKQSSILGSLSPLESFISFHENLLSFFETFLVVCRVPLLLLLQPLLWKMQPRLEAVKQGVKLDNPGHLEKLSGCIEHCQQLKKASQRICYFKGRQQLLQEMQEELKWISQNSGRVNRSYTTTVDNRQPKKSLRMRRNSEFLGKIKEEPDEMISSSSLPRVSSKKVMDKRPTTLSLSTRSASLSNPNDYKRVQCSSNKLKSSVSLINPILSSSIGEGIGMKKRSSEIRTRTRFMDSIENLEEEEEECFLVPAIGDSNGKERFSMHLSPQKRGRSPKLSRRGSEEDLSFEYMANVDEDLFKSDQLVIENSMSASPIRSPHSHGCVKEQNCLQENANATNLSLCPPKKKVAFKKRSGSRSPSPHFQTVRVEVHYSKEEENEDEMKESEWKELEEAIGDGSLRSMGSPLLQTMETEMSRSDDLDTRITSNTQFLFSSETSREYLKEKSNSVGSSSTKHALTKVLKRSKSPSYSAINKLSISQPCVASDDTNQLLDVCEGGNRNSAYHEWGGITSDDNGMLVKSHSVDHAQKLCVGSYSFGSHNVSSA